MSFVNENDFWDIVESLEGKNYKFWNFKGYNEEILIRHENKDCGFHEFYATPELFVEGYRCPKCSKSDKIYKRKKAINEVNIPLKRNLNNKEEKINKLKEEKLQIKHENFCTKLEEKFGDVYNVLENYKTTDTKILIEHKCEDGDWFKWSISPSNLLNGKGLCPKCSGRSTGITEYKRKVLKKYGCEYLVLGEYTGVFNHILMKHNTETCQHEFYQTPKSFVLDSVLCPLCSPSSKGEDKILKHLIKEGKYYQAQYSFIDCKNIKPLRFDFAIFKDKEKTELDYLIEYQGKHHYEACTFNSMSKEKSEQNLKTQNIKDNIKKEYCISNNIKLVEIAYWDYDKIENIL